MQDDQLRPYVDEIIHQRDMMLVAVRYLNAALQAPPEQHLPTVFHYAASQAILTAAAQVSKLLWADTSRDWTQERIDFANERAAKLRRITAPRPILQKRSVRNSVEHLDARLDDRQFEARDTPTLPLNAPGLTKAVVVSDRGLVPAGFLGNDVEIIRNLDPTTLDYTAIGVSVSLQELVDAVEEVASRAEAWVGRHPVPAASREEYEAAYSLLPDDVKHLLKPPHEAYPEVAPDA